MGPAGFEPAPCGLKVRCAASYTTTPVGRGERLFRSVRGIVSVPVTSGRRGARILDSWASTRRYTVLAISPIKKPGVSRHRAAVDSNKNRPQVTSAPARSANYPAVICLVACYPVGSWKIARLPAIGGHDRDRVGNSTWEGILAFDLLVFIANRRQAAPHSYSDDAALAKVRGIFSNR